MPFLSVLSDTNVPALISASSAASVQSFRGRYYFLKDVNFRTNPSPITPVPNSKRSDGSGVAVGGGSVPGISELNLPTGTSGSESLPTHVNDESGGFPGVKLSSMNSMSNDCTFPSRVQSGKQGLRLSPGPNKRPSVCSGTIRSEIPITDSP